MMTEDALLAELRALLYEKPSSDLWSTLWRRLYCQWLDISKGKGDAASFEAAVGYARSHLDGWPCSLRKIRFQSIVQWQGKKAPLHLPLAEHVTFAVNELDNGDLIDWCQSPWCHPIESLHLTTASNDNQISLQADAIEALLASPVGARLKRLKVTSLGVDRRALVRLTEHRAVASLARLELLYAGIEVECARLLARSPHLAGLSHLNLCNNQLDGDALQLLLESPCIPKLKALLLQDNEITDDGIEALSMAPFTQLETLFLGQNRIWSGGLYSLARASQLSTLKHLDLRHISLNRGGSNMLEAIGVMPHLKGLEQLSLCGATPDIEDFCRFAESAVFPRLTSLDMSENPLRQRGLKALLESSLCEHVKTLELRQCELDAPAIHELAESPRLGQLRHLGLSANPIDGQSWRLLLRSPEWSGAIRSLDVSRAVLDDGPVHEWNTLLGEFALTEAFSALTSLRMSDFRIDETGFLSLLSSPYLTQLRRLDLSSNPLGLEHLMNSEYGYGYLEEELPRAPLLSSVEILLMGQTRIPLGALRLLFCSPILSQLKIFHGGVLIGTMEDADAWFDGVWPAGLQELQATFSTSGLDMTQLPYDWPADAQERALLRSDLLHSASIRFREDLEMR